MQAGGLMKLSMAKLPTCCSSDIPIPSVKSRMLDKAVCLARKVGHFFIATADLEGVTHIAAASVLEKTGSESVVVSDWFCPGTVRNLRQNNRISLVIWKSSADFGYQLIGYFEEFKTAGLVNGYAAERGGSLSVQQSDKRLLVRIQSIITFTLGPHSDAEEGHEAFVRSEELAGC